MLFKALSVIAMLSLMTGCASIVSDKTQPIKVEAMTESGEQVTNAQCDLQNDRGAYDVTASKTVFVRKSAGDLTITCTAPDQPQADGKLISRTGGAVFGNILFGGVVGAVIDTASGVAYNYPEWVQLVFGRTLTFDRKNYKEAQPTLPTQAIGESPTKDVQSEGLSSQDNKAEPTQVIQKTEYITIVAPGAAQAENGAEPATKPNDASS